MLTRVVEEKSTRAEAIAVVVRGEVDDDRVLETSRLLRKGEDRGVYVLILVVEVSEGALYADGVELYISGTCIGLV